MIDLTDILLSAEQYNCSWSKESLELLIRKIENITYDWDKECGERWATIYYETKFIGYISSVVPLSICKITLAREIEDFLEKKVIIIKDDDFENKRWCIGSQKLKQNIQKLKWIIDEQMLDFEQFSSNDFWYATI